MDRHPGPCRATRGEKVRQTMSSQVVDEDMMPDMGGDYPRSKLLFNEPDTGYENCCLQAIMFGRLTETNVMVIRESW